MDLSCYVQSLCKKLWKKLCLWMKVNFYDFAVSLIALCCYYFHCIAHLVDSRSCIAHCTTGLLQVLLQILDGQVLLFYVFVVSHFSLSLSHIIFLSIYAFIYNHPRSFIFFPNGVFTHIKPADGFS